MKIQVQLNGPATPLLEIDEEQYSLIKQALFPRNEETRPLFFTLSGECADPGSPLRGTTLTYHINVTTVTYVAIIGGEFDVPSAPKVVRLVQ